MSGKNKEKKAVTFKMRFTRQEGLVNEPEQVRMVTEWNYARIAMALALLFIFIVLAINLFSSDNAVIAENSSQNISSIKERIIEPELSSVSTESIDLPKKKQQETSVLAKNKQLPTKEAAVSEGKILRAQLAKGIWETEPFAKITGNITVNDKEATGVYYFTELEKMNGKTVFHIWKYNDTIIFKAKKNILDDHWKTYSSKLFTGRSIGSWSVETIDADGHQLNIILFNVVAEKD